MLVRWLGLISCLCVVVLVVFVLVFSVWFGDCWVFACFVGLPFERCLWVGYWFVDFGACGWWCVCSRLLCLNVCLWLFNSDVFVCFA